MDRRLLPIPGLLHDDRHLLQRNLAPAEPARTGCLSAEVSFRMVGAEQLYQVKRMQGIQARVVLDFPSTVDG